MTDPGVRVSAGDGVVTIVLDRPEARNALSVAMIRELAAALDDAEFDDAARAVILTGADPAFCAGGDLRELSDPGAPRHELTDVIARVAAVRTPLIAAVNGAAATGGLEIVLGCDFVIASERASFLDTHARIGTISGSGMAVRLPQAVGLRTAKQMSLTGRPLSAAAALRAGLVTEVLPHDDLLPRARELAADIARLDPMVVRKAKDTYDAVAATTGGDGLLVERQALAELKAAGGGGRWTT